MSNLQWIACTGYAQVTLVVPAGRNAVLPLMTMPDYSTEDPSALESTTFKDLWVERIVGQVTFVGQAGLPDADYLLGWRLQALPWDPAAAAFDVPWASTDSPLRSVDISNSPRWWGERWYQLSAQGAGFWAGFNPEVSHPFWTHVDIRPKQGCGPHNAWEYPALVADNTANAQDILVYHRLRMLVEVNDRGG